MDSNTKDKCFSEKNDPFIYHKKRKLLRILLSVIPYLLLAVLVISNLLVTSRNQQLLYKVSQTLLQITSHNLPPEHPCFGSECELYSDVTTKITKPPTFSTTEENKATSTPFKNVSSIVPTTASISTTNLPKTSVDFSTTTEIPSTFTTAYSTESLTSITSKTSTTVNFTSTVATTTLSPSTTSETPKSPATTVLHKLNPSKLIYRCSTYCSSPQIIKAQLNMSLSISTPNDRYLYETKMLKTDTDTKKFARWKTAFLAIKVHYESHINEVEIIPEWYNKVPVCMSFPDDVSWSEC